MSCHAYLIKFSHSDFMGPRNSRSVRDQALQCRVIYRQICGQSIIHRRNAARHRWIAKLGVTEIDLERIAKVEPGYNDRGINKKSSATMNAAMLGRLRG